jgi:hypothetical protein
VDWNAVTGLVLGYAFADTGEGLLMRPPLVPLVKQTLQVVGTAADNFSSAKRLNSKSSSHVTAILELPAEIGSFTRTSFMTSQTIFS